ncbi:TPA: hypothetical protein DIC38_01350 [Candidatus Nomurabacteria bacterium]|nr:hypothetical protein [Candidatus Nomurabacteria bacterium]
MASVVLASLSSARQKGADAKIQAQISNMRSQSLLYSGIGTAFTASQCPIGASATNTLFETANNGLGNLFEGLDIPATRCVSSLGLPADGATWAVSSSLSSGVFCVDSSGWASTKNRSGVAYTTLDTAFTVAQTQCN